MNKKGNVFMGVAIGLFLFVMGILFLPFLTGDITNARNLLDCSNSAGITTGTKLMCLNIDLLVPYFLWFVMAVALGYIGDRG